MDCYLHGETGKGRQLSSSVDTWSCGTYPARQGTTRTAGCGAGTQCWVLESRLETTPETLSLSPGPILGVDFLQCQILLPNSLHSCENGPQLGSGGSKVICTLKSSLYTLKVIAAGGWAGIQRPLRGRGQRRLPEGSCPGLRALCCPLSPGPCWAGSLCWAPGPHKIQPKLFLFPAPHSEPQLCVWGCSFV